VVIGPLAATLIYDLEPRLPYLVAAVLLLLVALWPKPPAAPSVTESDRATARSAPD